MPSIFGSPRNGVGQGGPHGHASGNDRGERVGEAPRGRLEKDAGGQEPSLFKLHLRQGRTLWGLMVREEQCLLDYLATRPEIDKQRVGATGMSMGCTRARWLSGFDDRVRAVVGVACFTRYTERISEGDHAGAPDRAAKPRRTGSAPLLLAR